MIEINLQIYVSAADISHKYADECKFSLSYLPSGSNIVLLDLVILNMIIQHEKNN